MLASIHQEEIAMSTVAFSIPEDVRAMREGLHAFVKAEVLTCHEKTKRCWRINPNFIGRMGVSPKNFCC